MVEYDNLVKQLRYCATTPTCRGCMWIGERCLTQMKQQAADAIEELSNAGSAYGRGWTLGYDAGREESKPRWIPVTERLPGEFGRYLCRYRVEEGETIGYCTDFGRYDPEHGEWFVGTVTHWMPLPPAPKEET